MLQPILTKFQHFRDHIFSCFSVRADATMELIDALSGNAHAHSVVELSLSPAFSRKYGSVRDAISHFDTDAQQSARIEQCLTQYCDPITKLRPFRLLVLDCTAAPRKYSKTLGDKGIVYAPNVTPGNKPIIVGHQYSILGFLPEREVEGIPWMLPLSTRRVATHTQGVTVGLEQLGAVVPAFGTELSVLVGDTAYGSPKSIHGAQQFEHMVLMTRLRSNRIVYSKASSQKLKITRRRSRGHALWYGDAFHLKDSTTWRAPDEAVSTNFTTRKGKQFTVHIQRWDEMLLRQKKGLPLNEYPMSIVRVTLTDEDGHQVYKNPLWLMVSGKRRQELQLIHIWQAYRRRYDVEHFFRCGKIRLLMDKFQTPEVSHEVSWWKIASLAYAQLYMARKLASLLPNPWEKYLPEMQKDVMVKPAGQVQKSFRKITAAIGTPARTAKPRGKPLGRIKGAKQCKRVPSSIVLKNPKWGRPQIAI